VVDNSQRRSAAYGAKKGLNTHVCDVYVFDGQIVWVIFDFEGRGFGVGV